MQMRSIKTRVLQWCADHMSGTEFWFIATATLLFNLGISIYLFLYSLFLLDLGYTEKAVGVFTSAMVLGGMAGTIPMGIVARRFGLKRVLAVTLLCTSVMLAVRVCWMWYPAQLLSSFLTGAAMGGWMVCLSPGVANAVAERHRPLAFSILFAVAIAAGCGGGLLGGYLPQFVRTEVLHGLGAPLSTAAAKRCVLLLSSFLVGLAALPSLRMGSSARSETVRWVWPGSFLKRFLVASAIWSAAVGIINPFAGPFFVGYLRMTVRSAGTYFSVAQLVQAGAVLVIGPWVLRKLGLLSGLLGTQLLTGLALAMVVYGRSVLHAEFLFCLFMSAQHMSDSGVQTLLMNRIPQDGRSDAAAMNYLVVALGQSCAAAAGGLCLSSYGYPWTIRLTACWVVFAAIVFRVLCGSADPVTSRDGAALVTQPQRTQ